MASEPPIKVSEVAASRGTAWLVVSFALFRRAPGTWLAMCAGWLSITLGLIIIPFLGGVVANFLQPVFFASFAITALRQVAGEPISMNDLFSGFRRNVKSLVNLGALLLIFEIAIFALMALLGLPVAPSGDEGFTMQEYVDSLRGREWILAFGFLLTVVVKGALWFAPPLIALHGMTTSHAIRWSIYAALSNIGAMMAYGATLLLLFLVAMIPWALGLIVVIPIMAISTYVGYREVFEAAAVPAVPSTPAGD
jgi:membrane-anchored glycerophosphoryl diester phosphodiesterase (GDPDase)